jgi:arylsulfatase A-like enzyme
MRDRMSEASRVGGPLTTGVTLIAGVMMAVTLSVPVHLRAATNVRPNILFILADDLAWNDLGCTGAKVWETPAIDRLAGQGMRFTQAYAPAPICSASRAAILTGRSPARLQLEFVTKWQGAKVHADGLPLRPPPFTQLGLEEITFAKVLQRSGYRTGFFGKWHVAAHHGRYVGWSPTHGPRQQGFDEAIEDFGGHTYDALARAPLEGLSGISRRGVSGIP